MSGRSIIKIRTSTLLQIAGGVFIAGSTGLYLLHNSVQAKVRDLPHYKQTFEIVSKHDKLLEALGTPIQIGKVDLADRRRNYVDKTDSRLRIPISGPIDGGFLNVLGVRKDEEDTFKTKIVEFENEDSSYIIYES